jgi:heme/copper-type cytochrome/quinol oxidase subunit 2
MRRPGKDSVTGKILVAVAIAIVGLVLVAGVSTMFVEGKKARTWSNRMMRVRVLAQFIAILIIMAVFYFARS